MAGYSSNEYQGYRYEESRAPPRQELLPFFLPGDGIIRQVIQTDLPRYLGNNAYSRPGQHQGVDGYWYSGYRPLTDAQIQSLKTDSQKWNSERDLMSRHYPNRDLPGYERSATFKDSLRINSDGSNPDHAYPSLHHQNPAPPYPTYNVGQAPSYHHPTPYGAPPAPQVTVGPGPPAPTNRPRYEFVPLPEGGKWYDHELKQWVVQPYGTENAPAPVPRPPRDDPQPGAPEESDAYRRQPEPAGAGPETPYYAPGPPYFPRT